MKLRTSPATAMRRRGLRVAGRRAIAVSVDLRLTPDEAEHDLDDRPPAAVIRKPVEVAEFWLQAGVAIRVPADGCSEAPTRHGSAAGAQRSSGRRPAMRE